jgi:hypothetical protein
MNEAITVGVTLALGLFYCWTSRINANHFFGRTVSAELKSTEEARAITRSYVLAIAVATLLSAAAGGAAVHSFGRQFFGLGVLLECVLFVFAFARAHGQAGRLAAAQTNAGAGVTAVREASLVGESTHWVPGMGTMSIPVALFGGAFVVALLVAAHGAGLGAGWSAFSAAIEGQGYSGLLGLSTGMMASAVGMLILFRTSARLRTRMAQYTLRACVAMEWIAVVTWMATLACGVSGVLLTRAEGKGLMMAAVVVALAVMVWNQRRFQRFVPAPVEMGGDERWRWGLFYVDRNDPALFVQSRCGAGFTLNYGRFAAWPISIVVVGCYLMLLVVPSHLR